MSQSRVIRVTSDSSTGAWVITVARLDADVALVPPFPNYRDVPADVRQAVLSWARGES